MKTGDYMIHLYLEKAKEIEVAEDADSVNPIVVMEVLGKKEFSS